MTYFKRSLLGTACTASICLTSLLEVQPTKILFSSVPVMAQGVQGYNPPPKRVERKQQREASAVRGCEGTTAALRLLTPSDHIATTVSGRPTFFWSVKTDKVTVMEFALVQPGVPAPIYRERIQANKSGVIGLTLPQSVPELKVAKQYRWTVALMCEKQTSQASAYASAWVQRVARSAKLSQELAATNNSQQRGLLYAQSGVWYDAVFWLYQSEQDISFYNPKHSTAISKLLRQVGLLDVAI